MKRTRTIAAALAAFLLLSSVPMPQVHAVTLAESEASDEASVPDNNALPYTFEQMLTVDDATFLSNPDISEHMKRAFRRTRSCEAYGEPRLIFRLNDNIVLQSKENTDEWKAEICLYLGIPEAMVGEVGRFSNYGDSYPLYLKFSKGCDAYTANRAVIWLTFQSTVAAMQHNYGNFPDDGVIGGKGYYAEDWQSYYDIPYSFDAFLAMDDDAFLNDLDIPEKVKERYQKLRAYETSHICAVCLRFEDDVTLPGTPDSTEYQRELFQMLGIPEEIVTSVSESRINTDTIQITFKNYGGSDTYQGYVMPYVYDKALIYLWYQPVISLVLLDNANDYEPDPTKNWNYYADLDDYDVYCEYCEMKGIQATDTLPKDQELFSERDHIRNMFQINLGFEELDFENLRQKQSDYFGFPDGWFREINSPLEQSDLLMNGLILYVNENAAETKDFNESPVNRLRAELTIWNSAFAQDHVIHDISTDALAGAAETGLKGDSNMDGSVDIMDVIAVNKFILGVKELDNDAQENADINGNGQVESEDSLAILKAALGIAD